MKFVHFKKSLEDGAAPIYVFDGEEEYFKERGEEMLKKRYLQEPALNYSVLHGESLKGGQGAETFLSAVQSVPFLSEKRIVKVINFYPGEKEFETYYKAYFEHPLSDTILLIVNSKTPKGKHFDLKKAPNVTAVDCSKADEEVVLRWIYTQFKRAGVEADAESCERIMRYCLFDMARIAGEVEKLKAYALDSKKISSADVDAVVYRDAEYKTYEMSNALRMRNYGKFVEIQKELLEKGMDETVLLSTLCSYFRGLVEILMLKTSDSETAKVLGMKEYGVKMNRRHAEMLGPVLSEKYFLCAEESLSKIKSGEMSPSAALTAFNTRLFFDKI